MGATIRFGTYGVVVLFDVAAGAPNEDRVDAKAISCVGEPGWLEQMLFPPTRDFEGEFESP
jgi:hypothetical protein